MPCSFGLIAAAACLLATDGPRRPLDLFLNTLQLEAHTAERDTERFAEVTASTPVGQVFKVGPDVTEVCRVGIWQAFWHASWQSDEVLVMTLWDSPQKQTSCGRWRIPYSRRMWESAFPVFRLDAAVQPGRSYYFELTVDVQPLQPAETPREWLLGEPKPGFAGGDRTIGGVGIARDDYPHGQAFVGGRPQEFDLMFQVMTRRNVDRDTLYSRAFAYLDLDYPPLEAVRRAAEDRDWDRAVAAMIAHFEGRADLLDPKRPRPALDPSYDTFEADLAAEQLVWSPTDGTIVDIGPHWNYYTLWPQRGGVGLTRGGMRKPLGEGYARTGNPKYARAFNDMLADFFVDSPSPALNGAFRPGEPIPPSPGPGAHGGSMWSGLALGARMIHGFHYYAIFADSPWFTPDVRAMWIFNLPQMAEVLERQRGGGNWATQMNDALFQFGLTYPEFRRAGDRVKAAWESLVANAFETVRPDGALREPTINYHMLVLNRYSRAIQDCRARGLEVPPAMVELVEKMFDLVMHTTAPDGTLVPWGDSTHPTRPEILERGAGLYDRRDFRYVFTAGREGTPPARTSTAFKDAGFCYLRNDWSSDSNFAALRCGPFGSHGHHDALSIVVAAFGHWMLIDPGMHTYGTPEARELTSGAAHNTLTVDGHDARSARLTSWHTARGFDFAAGCNDGFIGLTDVRHLRRLWFLKDDGAGPDLWLVWDDVEGSGQHEVHARYRFAPLKVDTDGTAVAFWTQGSGPNLAVRVIGEPQPRLSLGTGIAAWGGLTQVPVATVGVQGPLPVRLVSLLVPSRAAAAVEWKLQAAPCGGAGQAVWAEGTEASVLALAAHRQDDAPQALEAALPDGRTVRMEGAGAVIRFRKSPDGWQPAAVHGVGLRWVELDGRRLVSAADPQQPVDWRPAGGNE